MSCYLRCDRGLLFKVNKKTKHRFVFRCECPSGTMHSYAMWRGVDAAEFEDVIDDVVVAGNREGVRILTDSFGAKKIEEPDEGLCPF